MIVRSVSRRRFQTDRTAILVLACVLAAPIAAAEGNGLHGDPPDATHPWFVLKNAVGKSGSQSS
jgi:hypothetical protein